MTITHDQARFWPALFVERPTCPHCKGTAFGVRWAVGDVFLWCKWKHCERQFWAIVLPVGTVAEQLDGIFGPVVARLLRISLFDTMMASARPVWEEPLLVPHYLCLALSPGQIESGPTFSLSKRVILATAKRPS